MNNFKHWITPEQAYEFDVKNGQKGTSIKMYENRLNDDSLCSVCETEPVWKYAGLGMCFSCTTGESDASEDFELIG